MLSAHNTVSGTQLVVGPAWGRRDEGAHNLVPHLTSHLHIRTRAQNRCFRPTTHRLHRLSHPGLARRPVTSTAAVHNPPSDTFLHSLFERYVPLAPFAEHSPVLYSGHVTLVSSANPVPASAVCHTPLTKTRSTWTAKCTLVLGPRRPRGALRRLLGLSPDTPTTEGAVRFVGRRLVG
jgi:hypothetical protein